METQVTSDLAVPSRKVGRFRPPERFIRRCPRHHLELVEILYRAPGTPNVKPYLGCPGRPPHQNGRPRRDQMAHAIVPWATEPWSRYWEVFDTQAIDPRWALIYTANYHGVKTVGPGAAALAPPDVVEENTDTPAPLEPGRERHPHRVVDSRPNSRPKGHSPPEFRLWLRLESTPFEASITDR